MDSSMASLNIVDGHEENELSTKKRPSKGGWKSAAFIILVEIAERFTFYGVLGNLVTYFTNVLGQTISTAAKNVNTWVGVSMILPIFGAAVADSYLGRFKTIIIASVIYLLGAVLLALSVSVASLQRSAAAFFVSLYILTIGLGGHKPCVQTFAADQFDENIPEEKIAKVSFFNWWFFGIEVGGSVAIIVVVYVQDNIGWGPGFGILAGAIAVALVVFLCGIPTYRRRQKVASSPFVRVVQVFVAATKKRSLDETSDGYKVYHDHVEGQTSVQILARTNQYRFLDKAAIIDEIDDSNKTRNCWRLCSVNQVEEVKLLLRLVPIWFACLPFAILFSQTATYFTKQGSTTVRTVGSFKIPPATLQVNVAFAAIVFIPLYDRVLVPIARKVTGLPSGMTTLQRMGIGLFLSTFSMVAAALVEAKRISIARDHGIMDSPKSIVPMRVFWLLPQYIITGVGAVFFVVGMQQLFYDQIPDELRSMGAAASNSTLGVGNFLSSAIISILQAITSRAGDEWLGSNLNRAHLDYFYWVLAGLGGLNLCFFHLGYHGFCVQKT
ncbi:Protein NRT1/ PTR family 5.4 [Vitis vinifera]|uniref:Protein NRT1/ PTR family 5.4 n=1 Tax=Vitis vinifera TaxID=29760 RepID=A0A438GPX5_VITVI|nr:Protein NRT1/ PTR family 5.4 [Vitis vinifera]